MEGYNVIVAVARGIRDTGQRIQVDVVATSRLDAAITAEQLVECGLKADECAHATTVTQLTNNRPGPAMALAA